MRFPQARAERLAETVQRQQAEVGRYRRRIELALKLLDDKAPPGRPATAEVVATVRYILTDKSWP